MNNLIIYTFGTSDLYVNGKVFGKNDNGDYLKDFNFEQETGKLKEDFGENKITFPIFEKLIEKLDKNYNYKVLGIFTKQPYKTDTYNLEKIFEKYLNKNFNNIKLVSNNIILNEAQKTNVIFTNINNFINENKKFFDRFNKILLNLTGGTKGIILGTFQACLSNFNIEKLRFFTVNENDNRVIEFINIKNSIIKNNDLHNIKLLINNFDFKGLYNFTKQKKEFEKINKISEYSFKLFDFEVEKANQIYDEIENEYGINLPFYFQDTQEKKVQLALDGIFYTWKTQKLVEFMGRIYSFSDILLSFLINNNLKLNIEKYEDIKNLENSNLEEFLNNYEIENNKLDWNIKTNSTLRGRFLNLPVKKAILEYYIKEESFIDLEKYLNFIIKLEKLNKYRNKTIIAHGTEGISLEKIKDNYEGDFEKDLKEIYKKLDFGEKFLIEKIKDILELML